MSPINRVALLSPVSAAVPCGADLSYDPGYLELERLAQGTPEQQVGQNLIPAVEPDWKQVRDRSMELFGRTRDLRVAVYLTLALLQTEGLPGFRDGLALVRGLLEKYWDALYPSLDPSDANPALERVNVISALSAGAEAYQDPMRFRQRLMEVPLSNSARVGRFGLRDMLIAEGELKPPPVQGGKPPVDRAMIEAALADTSLQNLEAARQGLADATELVMGIHAIFAECIGAGQAPDLDGLTTILKHMQRRVEEALARRGAIASPGQAGGTPAETRAASGEIRTPQDVVRALESICQYYERHEPSSPIPMLLRRAQRLVGKTFVDIVRDLTPEAVQQIVTLSGMDEKKG